MDLVLDRPQVVRKLDRLVVNVAGTPIARGNTYDVLRKTPGVIMANDEVKIGMNAATIYLNGRKVHLSTSELKTLLEGFSGENIASVEVIKNPPAEYDANDQSVINIVTKKNLIAGYKGAAKAEAIFAVLDKYNLATNHYYTGKNVNLFVNYSYDPRLDYRLTEQRINYQNDENDIFSVWDTDIEEQKDTKKHSLSLVSDWELNDKNDLSVLVTGVLNPEERTNSDLRTLIGSTAAVVDSAVFSENEIVRNTSNWSADLSWKKAKIRRRYLKANFHSTRYHEDFVQNIASRYVDLNSIPFRSFSFDTNSKQDIRITSFNMKYSNSSENGVFRAGVKIQISIRTTRLTTPISWGWIM